MKNETTLPTLLMIRRKLPELSGNFKAIAEQILSHPQEIVNEKVCVLAERSLCDSAQVVRFCQRLGFKGFSDLKNKIIKELLNQRRTLDSQIPLPENSFDQLKKKFADSFIRTINDTLHEIREEQMRKALELLKKSRLILISGFGSSGQIARDLHTKLLRLGFYAMFLEDAENARTECAALTKEDLLIAISFSGTTKYLLDEVNIATRNHVPVLGITNYPDSPLAGSSTVVLLTTADEQRLRLGAMDSIISQYLVVDLLISLLAGNDRKKTEERIIAIFEQTVVPENDEDNHASQ